MIMRDACSFDNTGLESARAIARLVPSETSAQPAESIITLLPVMVEQGRVAFNLTLMLLAFEVYHCSGTIGELLLASHHSPGCCIRWLQSLDHQGIA